MGAFTLADLPPEVARHVPAEARFTYPRQGMTAQVAFAEHEGVSVVVKRCTRDIYLSWLRREQLVLRALAGSELPIPRFIAYAETESRGAPVSWLVMSRLPGAPLLRVAMNATPAWRETVFRRLGELLRQMHTTRVPPQLLESGTWVSRQLAQARQNLPWCDGSAAGLIELERSQPAAVPETLIHGDLALDNVLVDEHGALYLIDWAGGGSGDPRHDIALALDAKPELDLSVDELAAFYAGYGTVAPDEHTLAWFVRLFDYF